MLIDERAAATPPVRSNHNVQVGADATEQRQAAMVNAVMNRSNPKVPLTEAGKAYRRMTLRDLAIASLVQDGHTEARHWTDTKIFSTAMRAQSTSDFPYLLADVTNKSLLASYAEQPALYEQFCAQATIRNLQTRYPVILSGVGTLAAVAEGADYPINTLLENRESYALVKRGQIVQITLEALMKDDLSGFTRIPEAFARAARRAENAAVFGLLTTNGAMADGFNLFSTDHANLAAAPAAPSASSLAATRLLVALQTGLKGEVLDLGASILVAPVGLEDTIEALFSPNYVPTASTGVLSPRVSGMERIYSANLTGTAWYMLAPPGDAPVIEYAFPDGESALTIEEDENFVNDVKSFKVRHWFGAGVVDFRGGAKNAGA